MSIVEETNESGPIVRALKGNGQAVGSGAPITLSPDAPVFVGVSFLLAGSPGTIDVIGVANPADASRLTGAGRTGRTSVSITGSGASMKDAMSALRAFENVVRSTAGSFGLGAEAVELRDVSVSGPS